MGERKSILVTGASTGIGAATASRLARDGHEVMGTSRAGGTTAEGIELLPLDVRSDESVRACVEAFLARAGRIDVLVNNAGFLQVGAVEEVTLDEARAQFETNYFGVVRMVKAVLPAMRARRRGLIATTSSLAGLIPLPFWGHYDASKFAVEGLMEALRHELRPLGIRVAMVEPGMIRTALYAHPPPPGEPAYSPWRDRFLRTMRNFEEKGPGPEVVAEVYSRIVRSERPALHHRLTREATLFPFLRWLLPAGAFEGGLRTGFHLDQAGWEKG